MKILLAQLPGPIRRLNLLLYDPSPETQFWQEAFKLTVQEVSSIITIWQAREAELKINVKTYVAGERFFNGDLVEIDPDTGMAVKAKRRGRKDEEVPVHNTNPIFSAEVTNDERETDEDQPGGGSKGPSQDDDHDI